MIGAIIGDIVGSTYEFHNTRDYNFELFPEGSSFTDDTICTIAIADAILKKIPYKDSLIDWCRRYPHPKGAYGASFSRWINSSDPQPYDSFGNGAAMRVSPIGWAFNNAVRIYHEAAESASCSHSHEEGIKGAAMIAQSISMLRTDYLGNSKKEVRKALMNTYGSDYEDRLPIAGVWDETCMGCVPLAIHLFLISRNFEDAIRLAVSYGGDSDTLGAIVGSLAGAFYTIPSGISKKAIRYLPKDILDVVLRFSERYDPYFIQTIK